MNTIQKPKEKNKSKQSWEEEEEEDTNHIEEANFTASLIKLSNHIHHLWIFCHVRICLLLNKRPYICIGT